MRECLIILAIEIRGILAPTHYHTKRTDECLFQDIRYSKPTKYEKQSVHEKILYHGQHCQGVSYSLHVPRGRNVYIYEAERRGGTRITHGYTVANDHLGDWLIGKGIESDVWFGIYKFMAQRVEHSS